MMISGSGPVCALDHNKKMKGKGLPFQSISGRSVLLLVRVVRSLGLELGGA